MVLRVLSISRSNFVSSLPLAARVELATEIKATHLPLYPSSGIWDIALASLAISVKARRDDSRWEEY